MTISRGNLVLYRKYSPFGTSFIIWHWHNQVYSCWE